MSAGNKISKGGLIGAVIGLLASLVSHKNTDSAGKKVAKSGLFGVVGYLLGDYTEKKINKGARP